MVTKITINSNLKETFLKDPNPRVFSEQGFSCATGLIVNHQEILESARRLISLLKAGNTRKDTCVVSLLNTEYPDKHITITNYTKKKRTYKVPYLTITEEDI